MVQLLSELQDVVKRTVALINKVIPVLTEEVWLICKNLTSVLKPFEEVTVQISGDKYVTGSNVIVLVNRLMKACEKMKHQQYSLKEVNVVNVLLKGLTTKMKNIEHSKAFALASLLDPRYKLLAFIDKAAAESVKRYCTELSMAKVFHLYPILAKVIRKSFAILEHWYHANNFFLKWALF
ncbi:hypothetical protein PR048_000864 [Dryococelus australis]|uniref:Uncharacterized protein n=1 Tax=Dryococelus australis TaxID=614101 RepID=A0ABQ9IFS4_9NEOP|nr:hypothetical protein PR048_000864 [Dryococelus australis]